MALVMRVIPVEMYEQLVSCLLGKTPAPSTLPDRPDPITEPESHADAMEVDTAPADKETEIILPLEKETVELPPEDNKLNMTGSTFPEWKEYTESSTQTNPPQKPKSRRSYQPVRRSYRKSRRRR